MQSSSLVVDVNFYAAELNVHEAERYIEIPAKKRGLSADTCQEVFKAILSLVQTVATDAIVDLKNPALKRIQSKDPNDWQEIAAAMRLNCPIWNLPDEADNHLVELAVAGGAVAIVTHNVRDLSAGELHFEGIETLKPAAFLAKFFGDKQ